MKNSKVFSALFLLAFACCRENSVEIPSPKTTIPIMPLSMGNSWNVRMTFTDTNVVGYDSTYVVRDTTIRGEKWFQVSSIHVLARSLDYLTNRSDGLYMFNVVDSPHVFMLIKYPTEKGDKFQMLNEPVAVLSVNDTVEVPAGKIVCCHYGFGGAPLYLEEFWYAPNIGVVKEEAYTVFQSQRFKVGTVELVSYRIH